MKIVVVGTGYVGLPTGVGFAELGFDVTCIDNSLEKVESLNKGFLTLYEPGLGKLFYDNVKKKRIHFTTELSPAVQKASVVILAVGTPTNETTGEADLHYVFQAIKDIAPHLEGYTVIATKSTVPYGTGDEITRLIHEINPKCDVDVISIPEFLREGHAIEDFMKPDRIIIGLESERAKEIVGELYSYFEKRNTPIIYTKRRSAEIIKYASNAFLATKITFINEVSDLCEKVGANIAEVAQGMGLDTRIGSKFLQPGPGYGGSCLPKDTLALVQSAKQAGIGIKTVETVVCVNQKRIKGMAQRIIDACDGDVQGKKIALWGVSFKANTDDIRYSPALTIIPILEEAGAHVIAYDPEAMIMAKKQFPTVTFVENAYNACVDADICVLLTEWPQFMALDFKKVKKLVKTPRIIDLRNVLNSQKLIELGFTYIGLGQAPKMPNKTSKDEV